MSRRLVRTSLTTAKVALGLAALLMSANAQAVDTDKGVEDIEDTDGSIKGETAIFARFADLGTEETAKRLDAMLDKEETAELVYAMTKALSSDDVTAKDIEKTMLSLIKGMKTDESDATVAALMLDYYEQNIAGRLEAGKLGVSDAFDELGDRADVVITAAYGSFTTSGKKTTRYKAVKRLRRRV